MGTRKFLSAWIVGGGIWITGIVALIVIGAAAA